MGFGTTISAWSLSGSTFTDFAGVRGNAPAALVEAQIELSRNVPPALLAKFYGPTATNTVGGMSVFSKPMVDAYVSGAERRGLAGVHDALGVLVAGNPGRNGMLLVSASGQSVTVSPARRKTLERWSMHLSAGLRLRLSLAERKVEPEAILLPTGAVAWAKGVAKSSGAREALARGVRDIERARGRLRSTSPEEALSLWKGLVAGRWSVVEWIDTDSRRYLVAHQNQVSARDPRALSPRELDVAEFLIQGRSTSEIAYGLGLSAGTISRIAREVLRKLGRARRTDLPALFGSVAPFRAGLPHHEDLVVLAPGSDAELWRRFTPAERDVISSLLRGERPVSIARRRGVSLRTVTTQIGTVYARFGVRGRAELASLLGHSPP